jgi:pyruvate,water dikinase
MVVCRGKARGRVAVVHDATELSKVQDGDILVTGMTTPDYIPALRKAAAFVTDEGGVTCHAAIVARELKKPCIVGTKVATRVLTDGALVEVDADSGWVRPLS